MKNLTWQNPEQLFVAQVLINKVKSKCCGIKDKEKEKTRRENLSKFIYQLANTCFTAMVVVAAVGLVLGVEDAKPYALLLGVGLFSTIFLALFADNILKRK